MLCHVFWSQVEYKIVCFISASDITKVDDIELQEIAEKASDLIFEIKDIQTDTDDLFEHPLRKLLGLDTQLRSIKGSLNV